MTPEDFTKYGQRLFGRKKWKTQLANALCVNVSTIHRMVHRAVIPGPWQVAIRSLLEQKKQHDAIETAARKLLPKGYKRWHVKKKPTAKRRPHIPPPGPLPPDLLEQLNPQPREEPNE